MVEASSAEHSRAVFAPMQIVAAWRIASSGTKSAQKVPVAESMVFYYLLVPSLGIEDVLASSAPVSVVGQSLLPDIIAFYATLAE